MFKFFKKEQPEAIKPIEVENTMMIEEDSEIIAVITAAVASMLQKSTSSFKIKSIKRASNWNKIKY